MEKHVIKIYTRANVRRMATVLCNLLALANSIPTNYFFKKRTNEFMIESLQILIVKSILI